MPFVLLLGGARSGKSALAQEIAGRSGRAVTLIATAEAGDEEMAARIAQHRAQRPPSWETVEEPAALVDAVLRVGHARLLVVDCLTLWVSNLLLRGQSGDAVVAAAARVAGALAARPSGSVVVSNEVGLGIVPANQLARDFRDTLGSVNAVFAGRAERAMLMVAGRVVELMPPASLDGFIEGLR